MESGRIPEMIRKKAMYWNKAIAMYMKTKADRYILGIQCYVNIYNELKKKTQAQIRYILKV